MMTLALPVWRSWRPDLPPAHAGLSLATLVAVLSAVAVLRRRILSLHGDQLRFVAAVHLARVAVTTVLMTVMWCAALPTVPLAVWIG